MADQVVLRFVDENNYEKQGNGIYADVSGNRLPLKRQSTNNFCGIDISQPTPSESLTVPSFSLVFSKSRYKQELWPPINLTTNDL